MVPENSTIWKHLTRPVSLACWMAFRNRSIQYRFELSRMDDSSLRLACVEALSRAGFKLTKDAFNKDAIYSRFYRQTAKIEDMNDEQEVETAVRDLLRNDKTAAEKVAEALQPVLAERDVEV